MHYFGRKRSYPLPCMYTDCLTENIRTGVREYMQISFMDKCYHSERTNQSLDNEGGKKLGK